MLDTDNISINNRITINKNKVKRKYIYRFLTRTIDIIGSICGLIILSPIFLLVAFEIKKEESKGTIFYSQIRIGKGGHPFRMYKFRSMRMNADKMLPELLKYNEIEGAMFKIRDDPRVTKIGKFIRKTSIDELPQLINVLRGDMRLVGPRPPLEREVATYSEYDMQRLTIKPGCTGPWQVSGRNNVSFAEMVDLDLHYIQHMSLWGDFKIIVKTIVIMIYPNGAY